MRRGRGTRAFQRMEEGASASRSDCNRGCNGALSACADITHGVHQRAKQPPTAAPTGSPRLATSPKNPWGRLTTGRAAEHGRRQSPQGDFVWLLQRIHSPPAARAARQARSFGPARDRGSGRYGAPGPQDDWRAPPAAQHGRRQSPQGDLVWWLQRIHSPLAALTATHSFPHREGPSPKRETAHDHASALPHSRTSALTHFHTHALKARRGSPGCRTRCPRPDRSRFRWESR